MSIIIKRLGELASKSVDFKCYTCKTEFSANAPDLKQEMGEYNSLNWVCVCPLCLSKVYKEA